MPFDIVEFKANLNKGGIFKTSNYEVVITQPKLDLKNVLYRCQSVDLPGRTVQTADYKTAGPVAKIGYEAMYTDINLNVICSETLEEKDIFEKWQDLIVGGFREMDGVSQDMFDIGYYDDYIGRVIINTYDETGKKSNSYTLEEAYPVSVLPLTLSWNNATEIALLPVTIHYKYYRKTEV